VRHSPRLYTQSDLGSNKDDVKSDGSLRLHIGRIHVVLLYKLLVDLQVGGSTELSVILSIHLHVLCLPRYLCVCVCEFRGMSVCKAACTCVKLLCKSVIRREVKLTSVVQRHHMLVSKIYWWVA